MRNPHGYSTIIDPSFGSIQENDVMTCIHCGKIEMTASSLTGKLEILVFRADGTHYLRECGFCRSCFEPVCPLCNGKPCDNRFRRLEAEEKLARKFTCD